MKRTIFSFVDNSLFGKMDKAMRRVLFVNISIVVIIVLLGGSLSFASYSGFTIVLDPGHGGTDPGSLGWNSSTYPDEADFNLLVAEKLKNQLQGQGATVYSTRTSDITMSLAQRVTYVNSKSPHAFISIHCNSFAESSANGTETWWHTYGTTNDNELASSIQNKLVAKINTSNRGVKQEQWAVLDVLSSIPAALSEMLFISNQSEFNTINTDSGRSLITDGLDEGIKDFLGVASNPDCYDPMVTLDVGSSAYNDSICNGYYQQYSFSITSGHQYKVTVTPSSGDPDLYLHNTSEVSHTTYTSESDNSGTTAENITFTAGTSGTYYAAVYGYDTDTSSYSIAVADVTPAATYTLSVNSSGASGVAITSSTSSTYSGVTNYSKSSIASGTSITLTAPSTSGTASFSSWTGCNSTSGNNCIVSITSSKTVTANYTTSCYDPMVTLDVGSSAYNDSICNGYYQQYSFSITSGHQYKVTVTPSSGDPDLYFHNTSEVSHTTYTSESDNSGTTAENITFTAGTSGTYYAAVYGYDTDTSSYSIKIDDTTAPTKTLTGIIISGPTSVNENSSASYTATASWSNGTTSTVTPTWTDYSQYATINTAGTLTTSSVTANRGAMISASYNSGGVTKTGTYSVTVVNIAATLTGITINGPTSVNENSSATYTATASWSNGTTSTVTPTWTDYSQYATINTAGTLTTSSVTANRGAMISASYNSGGVTKTGTYSVTVVNDVNIFNPAIIHLLLGASTP